MSSRSSRGPSWTLTLRRGEKELKKEKEFLVSFFFRSSVRERWREKGGSLPRLSLSSLSVIQNSQPTHTELKRYARPCLPWKACWSEKRKEVEVKVEVKVKEVQGKRKFERVVVACRGFSRFFASFFASKNHSKWCLSFDHFPRQTGRSRVSLVSRPRKKIKKKGKGDAAKLANENGLANHHRRHCSRTKTSLSRPLSRPLSLSPPLSLFTFETMSSWSATWALQAAQP